MSDEIMEINVRLTALRKQRDQAIKDDTSTDKLDREIAAIERDLASASPDEDGTRYGGKIVMATNYASDIFVGRPPTFEEAMMRVAKAEASGDGKAISDAWADVP